MGIAKAWRQLKLVKAVMESANESASLTARPGPRGSGGAGGPGPGMGAGFANLLADVLAPQLTASAERRGGPLPGSDRAVIDGSAWRQPVSVQVAQLRARDSEFDGELLAGFAEQVFSAVWAVWAGADAGTVRPVMSDTLWAPLAGATTLAGDAGFLARVARYGQQLPVAKLTGLHAGSWYDSARLTMHVTLAGDLPPDVPPQMTRWDEEWLFQRSVQPGGDPMIRPQACPACGASAIADDRDLCGHCRAPMPYLTTGWLATQIVSGHPFYAMRREAHAQLLQDNPDLMRRIPPGLRDALLPEGFPSAGPGQHPGDEW